MATSPYGYHSSARIVSTTKGFLSMEWYLFSGCNPDCCVGSGNKYFGDHVMNKRLVQRTTDALRVCDSHSVSSQEVISTSFPILYSWRRSHCDCTCRLSRARC